MSKYRRAARVDENQPMIVAELRKLGFSVELGHDDILVGASGYTFWYEIKTCDKAQIKESQKKLREEFKGHYKIVCSTKEILDDIAETLAKDI